MANTCFVVGPIGDEGTEARARADALLKHIIKKVLEAPPFGMVVTRADEMEPGLITQQIIERVVNADLVVADLTDRNANALYELALRHVTRKPVVHMLLAGQKLPFDIADQRTIYYDTKDLDVADQAKEDLKKQADAVLKNPEAADNPIMAALTVLRLRDSTTSTDQALARVLTELGELREDLRIVRRTLAPPVAEGPTTTKAFLDAYQAMNLGFGPSEGLKNLVESMDRLKGTDPQRMTALRQAIAKIKLNQAMSDNTTLTKTLSELSERLKLPDSRPTCANCGQPIAGPVGQRSADNAPIHWEGNCPRPPEPSSGVPSTSAQIA